MQLIDPCCIEIETHCLLYFAEREAVDPAAQVTAVTAHPCHAAPVHPLSVPHQLPVAAPTRNICIETLAAPLAQSKLSHQRRKV